MAHIVTDGYGRDRPTGLGACQTLGCLSYTRECAAKTGKSNLLEPLRGSSTKKNLEQIDCPGTEEVKIGRGQITQLNTKQRCPHNGHIPLKTNQEIGRQ